MNGRIGANKNHNLNKKNMLTTELIKKNIDLFNCLGLEGGSEDERAKVLFEFDAQKDLPAGLVILVSSVFNDEFGKKDFDIKNTRSRMVLFFEKKGFFGLIRYQPWNQKTLYKVQIIKNKYMLVSNYKETIIRRKTTYEFDASLKKFSYFNGKEIINIDQPDDVYVDFYEISSNVVGELFSIQHQSTNQNERIIVLPYSCFSDQYDEFYEAEDKYTNSVISCLNLNVVDQLENRIGLEKIIIREEILNLPEVDGDEYGDNDEEIDNFFNLINSALDEGGGTEKLKSICEDRYYGCL